MGYRTVRYSYIIFDRSRMVMQGTKAIMQDMRILRSENFSSVSKVQCYVCGKGLEDGYSITAKTLPHGIVLFCDVHYSLQ